MREYSYIVCLAYKLKVNSAFIQDDALDKPLLSVRRFEKCNKLIFASETMLLHLRQKWLRMKVNKIFNKISMKTIWMCGFSTRSFEELERIIDDVGYDLLIDIRTRPFSRWVPNSNRPILEKRLGEKYLFMGDVLGGLEDVDEEDFIEGVGRVCELANKGKKLILICSEKNYRKCHRHSKIEPELRLCGFNIIHL